MMQITKEHLAFLDEAVDAFEDNDLLETYRNDEGKFIALRYGRGRDCVRIFELGYEIGFFANMFPEKALPVGWPND